MGLISNILDLITTGREKKRYEEIMNNPEERENSTRFGKKFIRCAIGSIIFAALALAFSGVALYLFGNMDNLAMGFVFILYIICIGASVLFMLYSVLLILSRLKYIRWQRKLNGLPIGNTARIFSIIAFIVIIALCIVTVILLLKPLM